VGREVGQLAAVAVLAAEAEEVEVAALGLHDTEAGAAASAEDARLEVVRVDALLLALGV